MAPRNRAFRKIISYGASRCLGPSAATVLTVSAADRWQQVAGASLPPSVTPKSKQEENLLVNLSQSARGC
jgi:hypothetical protein